MTSILPKSGEKSADGSRGACSALPCPDSAGREGGRYVEYVELGRAAASSGLADTRTSALHRVAQLRGAAASSHQTSQELVSRVYCSQVCSPVSRVKCSPTLVWIYALVRDTRREQKVISTIYIIADGS